MSGSSPLLTERVIETFFQRDLKNNRLIANAVLVDMEPKVVQKCISSAHATSKEKDLTWSYDPSLAFYK